MLVDMWEDTYQHHQPQPHKIRILPIPDLAGPWYEGYLGVSPTVETFWGALRIIDARISVKLRESVAMLCRCLGVLSVEVTSSN